MPNKAIILLQGLPATGKTSTSMKLKTNLEKDFSVHLLTTLSIRKEFNLFNLYSEDQRQETYRKLSFKFKELTNSDIQFIIIDGNFNKKKRRDMIYTWLKSPLIIVKCICSNIRLIEARLNHRRENLHKDENKAYSMELYNLIQRGEETVEQDPEYLNNEIALIHYDTSIYKAEIINSGDVTPELLNRIINILNHYNADS